MFSTQNYLTGSYGSTSGPMAIAILVLSLAATIVLFVMVMPENKRSTLPKFFQVTHDIFNFKSLLLEKILKFLYTFATISTLIRGIILFFTFESYYGRTTWHGLEGLATFVIGPIIIRLVYELFMLLVLLVKNVIQINNKLKDQNKD